MKPQPVVQVLSKADYTEQHLITLPEPNLEPLSESHVRVKSSLLALTTNNLSYARMGHLVGWWDLHPLPESIPHPFNEASKYGRISAWGFGEVLESTVGDVPIGTLLYGYLPIGTLPVDLLLRTSSQIKDHFIEVSPHRSHLWSMYNRYVILPDAQKESTAEAHASKLWDALMLVFFETAYNLNYYVFPQDNSDITPVHPQGLTELPWSKPSSSLTKSIVVIFAASGKTALAFAQQLSCRPDNESIHVVGVTSAASRAFVEQTGFYKDILLYDDDLDSINSITQTAIAAGRCDKLVLADFGARDNAATKWLTSLRAASFCANRAVMYLGIGGSVEPLSHAEIVKLAGESAALGRVQVNASGIRDAAMRQVGEERYFGDFLAAWNDFKGRGAVPGLHCRVERGMEEVGKAWQRMCEGSMKADEGLLFEL